MRKKGWGNILLFFFAAFRYFWAPVGAWPALGSKLDAGVAALFSSSSSSSSSSSFLVLVLVFFFVLTTSTSMASLESRTLVIHPSDSPPTSSSDRPLIQLEKKHDQLRLQLANNNRVPGIKTRFPCVT